MKIKTYYECRTCGTRKTSWSGKCDNCGEWNTIQEVADVATSGLKSVGKQLQPRSITSIVDGPSVKRIVSGDTQFDHLLGGGLVPASVVLLAGQPGIGKSTLLMQLAQRISLKNRVLYISGEESMEQVAERSKRLNSAANDISLLASNETDDIVTTIASDSFDVVIVDSIQTIGIKELSSATGSVSQITASAQLLTRVAKQTNTVIIMVGHVTKEGSIAGPKVLEHSVDVVLQFEGDRYGGFKIVRAVKNRYGSTQDSALYEMTESGLAEVKNPSASLLAERQIVDGSVVFAQMEGTRAILVEIQALVAPTSFGYAKRTASGFDGNRLTLLIAMLERRTKLQLQDKDIYINVVGGIRLNEPAADLAVAMAIGSAAKGLVLKKNAVVFGELGLGGEVRHVPYTERRLDEALKMGFDGAIGPKHKSTNKESDYHPVSSVRDALNQFLESK